MTDSNHCPPSPWGWAFGAPSAPQVACPPGPQLPVIGTSILHAGETLTGRAPPSSSVTHQRGDARCRRQRRGIRHVGHPMRTALPLRATAASRSTGDTRVGRPATLAAPRRGDYHLDVPQYASADRPHPSLTSLSFSYEPTGDARGHSSASPEPLECGRGRPLAGSPEPNEPADRRLPICADRLCAGRGRPRALPRQRDRHVL